MSIVKDLTSKFGSLIEFKTSPLGSSFWFYMKLKKIKDVRLNPIVTPKKSFTNKKTDMVNSQIVNHNKYSDISLFKDDSFNRDLDSNVFKESKSNTTYPNRKNNHKSCNLNYYKCKN